MIFKRPEGNLIALLFLVLCMGLVTMVIQDCRMREKLHVIDQAETQP